MKEKNVKKRGDLICNGWWHGHNNAVPDQLRVLDNYSSMLALEMSVLSLYMSHILLFKY